MFGKDRRKRLRNNRHVSGRLAKVLVRRGLDGVRMVPSVEAPLPRVLKPALCLVCSLLVVIGLGGLNPANAATNVTINVTMNGQPLAFDGFVIAYTYDSAQREWKQAANAYTNSSGVASMSLPDQATGYRLCARSVSYSLKSQFLCHGADTVEDALTINGSTSLSIALAPAIKLDMSVLKVQGRPAVGQRLSSYLEALPTGLSTTYVSWYRDGDLSSPNNITGQILAVGAQYVVKRGDLGHGIRAYVNAWGPRHFAPQDFQGGSKYLTPQVGPVVLPMSLQGTPSIRAPKWKVGKIATYGAPSVVPAGASASFQWLRNGAPIYGQTSATHRLVRMDKGKKVSLRVTYSFAGYETTTLFTAQSPKVKK